jgi:23S rRNA (adenine-N6)-dimethyltransferase
VSQNFLTSYRTIKRLVGRTNLCRYDHVVEIGSGKGHITEVLAEICGRVTAVEIDPDMCSRTAKRTAAFSNVENINGTFLRGVFRTTAPTRCSRTSVLHHDAHRQETQ